MLLRVPDGCKGKLWASSTAGGSFYGAEQQAELTLLACRVSEEMIFITEGEKFRYNGAQSRHIQRSAPALLVG